VTHGGIGKKEVIMTGIRNYCGMAYVVALLIPET
jgi:hypothetical protein